MEVERAVPCAYPYNTMIMGYGSAGRFDDAYRLLERLRERGFIPSVVSFNSILICLRKKRKVDDSLSLLDIMKKDAKPNTSTYNIVIDMLCMAGRVNEAYKVRDEMELAGMFPNLLTFNIMVDKLCKAKHLEEAYKIFESASQRGCNPDSVTYCSPIDGLGKKGKIDEAYRLFEKMLDAGHNANPVVYTSLIRNFFMHGRNEDGHKIFKEMIRRECQPDLTLINTYMDCVFKAGEVDRGKAVLRT
jgi:pentatricopeptide repeat protein